MKITDIRQMFPSEYICHADLIGPDGRRHTMTLQIDRVEMREVVGDGGKKSSKPVLYFRPKGRYQAKPLVLNVTNGIAVASLHGQDPDGWPGKEITLYVGEAKSVAKWRPVYGKTMPALRIRGRSGAAEEMKEELRGEGAPPPEWDDAPSKP